MSLSVGDFSMKRQDEREKKDAKIFHCKFLSFTVSHTFFPAGWIWMESKRLHFVHFTLLHTIYRVKKELGGEVDKSEKGPKWPVELVNRFFLPLHAILCISSYESETKARAEKTWNSQFSMLRLSMNGNNKSPEKEASAKRKTTSTGWSTFSALCKNFPTFLRGMAETFATLIRSESTENPSQPPAQCDVICDFWCAHKFPSLTLDFCLEQWESQRWIVCDDETLIWIVKGFLRLVELQLC